MGFNRQFSIEHIKMPKDIWKSILYHIIREMKIKTTIKYHLIHVTRAMIKNIAALLKILTLLYGFGRNISESSHYKRYGGFLETLSGITRWSSSTLLDFVQRNWNHCAEKCHVFMFIVTVTVASQFAHLC